jgi:hypothetical protein
VNQENNYLFDIVGIAPNDAWAIGFYDTGTSLDSMVQHWNGTAWTIEGSPNPGDYLNELIGVGAISSTNIWAVGDTTDGVIGVDTLVMQYSDDCGTPSPTPTNPGGTPTPTKTPRVTPGGPTPTLTATPGGGSVHVGDLDGSSVSNGTKWNATVVVLVHNQSHAPVSNAVVSGSWSNGASGNGTCTTGADGKCSITRAGIRNTFNSVTFSVSGVASAFPYLPGNNHDPDGDSNGTVIVIAKP